MPAKRFLDQAYNVTNADETRALYDAWAEVYDTELDTENNYQQPIRCATALAAHLPDKQARILDLGCGTGLSGLALRQTGYRHIDGCDFSPAMLRKAEATQAYTRLFSADLNQPPLDAADASYDAVTAVGVFSFGHVVPDALDEILRVLKPGAPLVIGLNDHYYQEGSLLAKKADLISSKRIIPIDEVHGEHIPGKGLSGWVITVRKL